MNVLKWLAKVTGSDLAHVSETAIAHHAGLTQSTLNRRVKIGELTADMVIAICKAYDYDIITGLIEHGIITRSDITLATTQHALQTATDRQLTDEIVRRLEQLPATSTPYDEPIKLSAVEDTLHAALDPGYNPEDETY